MATIRVIAPTHTPAAVRLRVAAYARVSSDSADQLNSFTAQVHYYTNYIQCHPDWTFVDIYADEGLSGTSADKREEFLRLMRDCRQGKIDRVLTKSVSRFARNVQDCIEAVRELRQLKVSVCFEKERLDTALMTNEMLLSMMSAFAQEESVSISKNMRKGAVMRMKNGTFRISQPPYGYQLDETGQLVIQPEEAEVVQWIFASFLSGKGIQQIGKELERKNVPKIRGEAVWSKNVIRYLLTNERYIGDERFQKTYRSDSVPFKRYPNNGMKPQYYGENTHAAIIDRETFRKTQELLLSRKKTYGEQKTYPLTQKLYCMECGACLYRRVAKNGIQWVCSQHLHHPEQCRCRGVPENVVYERFLILLHKLAENRESLLEEYLRQLEKLRDRSQLCNPDRMELNRQIAKVNEQNHTLHRLWAKNCIDSGFFIAQINELEQKYQQLQEELNRCRKDNDYDENIQETKRLLSLIAQPFSEDFDPDMVQQTVSRILVSENKLIFSMKNGLDLEEPIERLTIKSQAPKWKRCCPQDGKKGYGKASDIASALKQVLMRLC